MTGISSTATEELQYIISMLGLVLGMGIEIFMISSLTGASARARTCKFAHARTHVRTHVHMHVHVRTHASTFALMSARMHTRVSDASTLDGSSTDAECR